MLHLMPKLAAFVLLMGVGLNLLGCSERPHGDATFKEVSKGFKKELTKEQREAAIKQLQTETAGDASKP